MSDQTARRMNYEGPEMDLPHNDRAPLAPSGMAMAQGGRTTDNPNEIVRDGGEHVITDDLDALLQALPPSIIGPLRELNNRVNLLEVVMDLGRRAESRYRGSEHLLTEHDITREEIDYVIERIGQFGG